MAGQEYGSDWTEEDIKSVQPISSRERRRRIRKQRGHQDRSLFIKLLTSRGRQQVAHDEGLSAYADHHQRRITSLRGKIGRR